jgi:serine/threonine protein kinase
MEGRLGKYEIRKTLGRGAAGTVYEAWDPAIARHVAIKTVKLPDPADTEAQEQLERFRREAQAAGRLTHPNIVGVFDYGETEDIAYIVMEYVDGESLKAVLDRHERFAIPDIIRVMDELLAGLGFSHERGVVHRDIKPANLMLTKDGRLKIADFGIARIESSGLTQVGTIMGTPAFMSPEQFSGQVVDLRTDLYSAGVVLYQLLTGDRPFEGSMTAIMQKALNTVPAKPSEISVTAPVAFDAVVLRAMAKRPEDRFASAAAFSQALHAAAAAPPAVAAADPEATTMLHVAPEAPPPSPMPSRPVASLLPAAPPAKQGSRLPLLVGVGGLAVLLAGGGAWFLLGSSSTPPAPPPPPPGVQSSRVTPLPPAAEPTTAPPVQATSPAATLPATPTPVLPPASAPPAPTLDRGALAAALAGVPCAMIGGDATEPARVRLNGVVSYGQASAALDRALAEAAAGATIERTIQVFPVSADYCRALDILRPFGLRFADAGAQLGLHLADDRTRLIDNDPIRLRLKMADFAGELRVDYLSSDGNIYHVFPADADADAAAPRMFQPGQDVKPGAPGSDGKIGEVGEPFGYDMIVAVASSVPLFSKPRAKSAEPADAYLEDLQAAIEAVRQRGGRVAANALVLETAPR